ncbi:MAG: hypothetical protein H6907_21875 [Hyphomicrobiales bacterium]|nr:hypothetical protein [Hyphomicrobiales bacterium]MCP5374394.1 hypothetical protein [Hyphomicrobiales bacterium]
MAVYALMIVFGYLVGLVILPKKKLRPTIAVIARQNPTGIIVAALFVMLAIVAVEFLPQVSDDIHTVVFFRYRLDSLVSSLLLGGISGIIVAAVTLNAMYPRWLGGTVALGFVVTGMLYHAVPSFFDRLTSLSVAGFEVTLAQTDKDGEGSKTFSQPGSSVDDSQTHRSDHGLVNVEWLGIVANEESAFDRDKNYLSATEGGAAAAALMEDMSKDARELVKDLITRLRACAQNYSNRYSDSIEMRRMFRTVLLPISRIFGDGYARYLPGATDGEALGERRNFFHEAMGDVGRACGIKGKASEDETPPFMALGKNLSRRSPGGDRKSALAPYFVITLAGMLAFNGDTQAGIILLDDYIQYLDLEWRETTGNLCEEPAGKKDSAGCRQGLATVNAIFRMRAFNMLANLYDRDSAWRDNYLSTVEELLSEFDRILRRPNLESTTLPRRTSMACGPISATSALYPLVVSRISYLNNYAFKATGQVNRLPQALRYISEAIEFPGYCVRRLWPARQADMFRAALLDTYGVVLYKMAGFAVQVGTADREQLVKDLKRALSAIAEGVTLLKFHQDQATKDFIADVHKRGGKEKPSPQSEEQMRREIQKKLLLEKTPIADYLETIEQHKRVIENSLKALERGLFG